MTRSRLRRLCRQRYNLSGKRLIAIADRLWEQLKDKTTQFDATDLPSPGWVLIHVALPAAIAEELQRLNRLSDFA